MDRLSVIDRILTNVVEDANGCWIWQKATTPKGYGQTNVDRKSWSTHRLAYVTLRGPIPEGLQLDHLCRVRACCNPEHLEAVTAKVNVLRGVGVTAENAAKTNCKRGHPFDTTNTYWTPTGRRGCRECRRMWALTCYHRRAAAKAAA